MPTFLVLSLALVGSLAVVLVAGLLAIFLPLARGVCLGVMLFFVALALLCALRIVQQARKES